MQGASASATSHMKNMEKTQGASTGAMAGMEYQFNVIIWNLLKGKSVYGRNYEITTELKVAGKFDDVVFKFPDGEFRLIQVKHSSGRSTELSFSHLLYEDAKPYNLKLYYDSYKYITATETFKGKIKDIVLFTNMSLSKDVLKFTQELSVPDKIFDFEKQKGSQQQPKLFKFKDDFIPRYVMCQELKEIAIKFVLAYLEKKTIDYDMFKQYGDTFQREVFDFDAPQVCFRSDFIDANEKSALSIESKLFHELVGAQIQSRKKLGCKNPLAYVVAEGKHKLSINKGEQPYAKNAKDEPIEQSLKDFLEHLVLAVNQPNKTELRECNLNELVRQYGMTVSLSEFASVTLMANVRKWYDEKYCSYKNGSFLEEFDVFEDEFRLLYHTLEFCKTLKNYKIEFQHNERVRKIEAILERVLNDEKVPYLLLKTTSRSGIIVNSIIVHQYLQREYQKQFLFVNLEKYSESLDHLLQLFKNCQSYDLLILSMDGNFQLNPAIEKGLEGDTEAVKKIIIIGNGNSNSDLIDNCTSVSTLSADTQNFILQKNINFQGHRMKFNEIIAREELIKCNVIDECLLGLTCTVQDITVGTTVSAAIEYYVNRTVQIVVGDRQQTEPTHIDDTDLSKFIYDSTESVVVISDIPGIGKTTVSSKLAEEFKKNYVTFWVSKFNLSEHVRKFRTIISAYSEMDYKEFIFTKLLKLSTEMERFIFNQYLEHSVPKSKFVFIFDGFDEIPTKCQENVISIIQYLQTKANVQFILVTTRPSMNDQLVNEFNPTNIFKLQPLNADNKTKFLVKYWSRINEDTDKHRLEMFADKLVRDVSRSQLDYEFDFTGIPLHLQMLADIFEKDAIDFVKSAAEPSQKSFSISMYNLYEKFFEIKQDLYIERNISRVEDFVEKLRPNHRQLALNLLKLKPDNPNDPKGNDEADVLEAALAIGFVQRNSKNAQYYFIHRTYGEFLLAEHVVVGDATPTELMCMLKLSTTYMVRAFLNDKIRMDRTVRIKDLDTVESKFYKDYIKRSIKENTLSLLDMMLTTFNKSKPAVLFATLKSLGKVEWNKESYCFVMKWIKRNVADASEGFKISSVLFQMFWSVYTLQEAYEANLQEVRNFMGEVGIPENDLFRLFTSEDAKLLDYFKSNENYYPAIQFQLKYLEENLSVFTKDADSKTAFNKFISKLLALSVEDSDEQFVCNWIQAMGDSIQVEDILQIPDQCNLDSIQYYTVWGRKHILRVLLKAGEDYDAKRVVQTINICDIPSERNEYLENCRQKAVRDGNTLLIDSLMTNIKDGKMFKTQFTIDPEQTTTNDFLISLLNIVWDRYSKYLIDFLLINKAFYFSYDAADGETVCDELNNRVIEIIEDTSINSNDLLRLLKEQVRRNKKTILHKLAYSNNVILFKRLLDCIRTKETKDGRVKPERLQSVLALRDTAKEPRTVAEIIDFSGSQGMREVWSEFETFISASSSTSN